MNQVGMPPLFPATVALYGVACVLFFAHLFGRETEADRRKEVGGVLRAARFALGLAFASHAVDIGWLCMHGMHPVVNSKEAVSFAAWMLCGIYLFVSSRFRVPALGVLVAPTTLLFDLAARLGPSPEARSSATLLAVSHSLLATVATAVLADAAGGGFYSMGEERALKQHRSGRLSRRGASLEMLDTLSRRCIAFGFACFTVALVTGAAWFLQKPDGPGLWSPQYVLASVAWLVYAALIAARIAVGLRGRRAAVLTVAGAATAVAVLLIYFVRDMRGA